MGTEAVGEPVRATVSVVSHGQGTLVRSLLRQLQEHAAPSVERVIVTCNIPEEEFLEGLHCGFPIELVRNRWPRGFGANHNAAFGRCGTPWFLVLNPDLRLPGDAIARLAQQAGPATGLLAPRIVEPGKPAPEPHRKLLTPLELVRRRLGRAAVTEPDWVAGMFMLFRADAFRAVGGFDEKFFMYVEDADICARLRLAGWGIGIDEGLRIEHDAQRASWRRWRPLLWHLASLARWWTSATFWRSLLRRA